MIGKFERKLQEVVAIMASRDFGAALGPDDIQTQKTRKEFEGDLTVVVFPLVRLVKKSPEETGNIIGEHLVDTLPWITNYNVVKGFLNLSLSDDLFLEEFENAVRTHNYGFKQPASGDTIMVEYSSPNTNKPLHLGHIRNILLGYSVSEILKANGHRVIKTQIVNDRGIHICKSMLAWKRWGNGETPESTGAKGDKLVGNYYVKFDQEYKKEVANLMEQGLTKEEAEAEAPIMKEAREMLRKWEARDEDVYDLWEKMNEWVYMGFASTYDRMGVDFDKNYYESETYLWGKDEVLNGVDSGIFVKKDDNSIWCDLTKDGLDEKLLLRGDGTAVYMTQDIGTAILRFRDYPELNRQVYTVGNEQEYHFKVLFLVLEKLGMKWANECSHLSYGMVDLPSGKMKSREGTVVDADDLMKEMYDTAKSTAMELGKIEGLDEFEQDRLFWKIGLGALKYFILKVDPKKRMLFNPEESIDFSGHTGPFIQYTHARIKSLLRKAEGKRNSWSRETLQVLKEEHDLMKRILEFPGVVEEAGKELAPSVVANYVYDLVKQYNNFYQNVPVLKSDNADEIAFRLDLSEMVSRIVSDGMRLLGIQVPDKM